jgi:transcriptional regulator with XRE-family HTH domain
MDATQARTDNELPTFIYRRFRAALDLRGASVESVARHASVSSRHVWHVLTGRRRGSAKLLLSIRHVLGEPGYAFAIGQTDTLRDDFQPTEGDDHAAS